MTYREKLLHKFTSEQLDVLIKDQSGYEWWKPLFDILGIVLIAYNPDNHPTEGDRTAFATGNGFRFSYKKVKGKKIRFGFLYNKMIKFNKPKQIHVYEVYKVD